MLLSLPVHCITRGSCKELIAPAAHCHISDIGECEDMGKEGGILLLKSSKNNELNSVKHNLDALVLFIRSKNSSLSYNELLCFLLILTPACLFLTPAFARLTPDNSQGVNLYSAVIRTLTCRWWEHSDGIWSAREQKFPHLRKKVTFAPLVKMQCDVAAAHHRQPKLHSVNLSHL